MKPEFFALLTAFFWALGSFFTTPLWGFLLAVTFAGEKVTLLKTTGAGLAIIGILILTAS